MKKQTVLISGGTSGLGKAVATELNNDYHVIVFSKDSSHVEQAKQELGCEAYVADVTKPETL